MVHLRQLTMSLVHGGSLFGNVTSGVRSSALVGSKMLLMQIMAICLRSWREMGPVSTMRLLVSQVTMLTVTHLMLTVILPMVSREMSSILTSMMGWLSHTRV